MFVKTALHTVYELRVICNAGRVFKHQSQAANVLARPRYPRLLSAARAEALFDWEAHCTMSDLGPPGSSSIPPTLDGDIFADTSSRETSTELPAYSRSATRPQEARPLTEHTFTLETSDRVPWLVLKVKSSAPSTKGLPVFVEGQPITGEVDLRLDKPENIKSVVVSVSFQVRSLT